MIFHATPLPFDALVAGGAGVAALVAPHWGGQGRSLEAPGRAGPQRASRAPRGGPRRRTARSDGWAGRRELTPLVVARPGGGRLSIGHLDRPRRLGRGPLLAAERRASLVVLGPSQSGKTTGLAIPAILEWDGPVVATSVKADLVRDTLLARSRRGPTWVYDATGATGVTPARWSPLLGAANWRGARRTSAWLCGAARAAPGGGEEDFWYAAAGKLLAPYLLAAARGGRDLGTVVRWVDAQEEDEVADILVGAGETEALGAARASWQRDGRTRSSVFTTAEMVLEAFADPVVVGSADGSDVDPGRLVSGDPPVTLYVCAPGHEQERLRPVFATLLQSVIAAAYETAHRRGPLEPPLLLVLDEAANIAPLRDLDAIAATAAGHGIQLVTVWQDLAQLRARYGERAATVVNNHRAKVVLSGISDPATLEYTSRLIGDGQIADDSVTTDRHGGRTTTRTRRDRPLAPDAELRRIHPGEGVLVYGHLRPTRIRLRPWYDAVGRQAVWRRPQGTKGERDQTSNSR